MQNNEYIHDDFREFNHSQVKETINDDSGKIKTLKSQPKSLKIYQYYKQQDWKNGKFDLRFQSIIKSPINYGPFDQFKFAAQFQLKKSMIYLLNKQKHANVLHTVPQKQFLSNRDEIKAYWLGHATVLLSIDSDTRIIIDPMFDDRVVSLVGEKRHLKPPCKVEELPKIDCVLISHDHYDHCNTNSLQSIYKKNKDHKITLLVGKNSKDILPKECLERDQFREMSWTQSYMLHKNNKKIKITFVPACHWSKRGLYDQNQRLWGGFVIQALGKKIYFAGDTGYCGLFEELYEEFGGFDLSLLPIGAYEPNEKLKAQHVNPRQAVMIHNQVKSKLSVGIHWGTFPMSHEQPSQVRRDFQQAITSVTDGQFKIISIGESVTIKAVQKQIQTLQNKNNIQKHLQHQQNKPNLEHQQKQKMNRLSQIKRPFASLFKK